MARRAYEQMVAHCLGAYPLEGCGLLAGPPTSLDNGPATATRCFGTGNAAASARVYTIEPKDHLHADREAGNAGLEIVGAFHSHTHTDAFPSPTDVTQAPVPDWHYVVVSLAEVQPVVRSYRIIDGNITEEALVLHEPVLAANS